MLVQLRGVFLHPAVDRGVIDWRTPLDVAAARTGAAVPVQGNLDPAVLFAGQEAIDADVVRIAAEGARCPGHVFNLGHGVLPQTDPDAVKGLVDFVHGYERV